MTSVLTDLDEARAHLGAALAQALPSDDQIIVGHLRAARELLDQHLAAIAKTGRQS